MRAQAQGLLSAANRDGSATRGSVFGRVRNATRASSSSADGSGAPSHRRTHFAIGLLVAALALLAIVPNASAFTTRAKTATFGPDGTSATSFSNPSQLAANQANDKLYVLARDTPAIHAFDTPSLTPSGGAFPLSVTSDCCDPDISVDNTGGASADNIYYVGGSGNGLFGFDSAGAGLAGFPVTGFGYTCGSGVDTTGHIWVGDYSAQAVKKYDSSGASRGSVDTSSQGNPCHVAFDSNDNMFVSMYFGATWKYEAPAYTTATQVDPNTTSAITVDRTAHTLYVAHFDKVSAYRASDGAFLYDFGSGGSGVAVDEGNDTVYVSDPAFTNNKVHAFSAAQDYGDASASPTGATAITDVRADLNARVTDNNALATSWRLELSSDRGANWRTVGSGQTAGGETDATIVATATGLTPGSDYRYRVVTNKGTTPATEVNSAVSLFRTSSVAPVVSNVGPTDVQDTSVRMAGTIDPKNSPTGYVFEYGTTPALGSSTAPVDIGGGTTPIIVSQRVGGLRPDTDYYFRLTATNAFGSTPGVQRTFHTRADPLPLSDNRGYEQVSPVDKNYGGIQIDFTTTAGNAKGAPTGEAAGFCSTAYFGDGPGFATCENYVSHRNAAEQRWETTPTTPLYCSLDLSDPNFVFFLIFIGNAKLSPDMSKAVFRIPEGAGDCPLQPLDPLAPTPAYNLYLRDFADSPSFDLLTPEPGEPAGSLATLSGSFLDGNDEFTHLVYQSHGQQTPEAPGGGQTRLFEWANGTVRLVAKDPANVPFASVSNLAYPDDPGKSLSTGGFNAVSADGSRIFFLNSSGGDSKIYMRENGTATHVVSASECTADCGTDAQDVFQLATPDGSKVLLSSAEKLTDDDLPGSDLFMYTHSETPATDPNLVLLSRDNEPADGIDAGVAGSNSGVIGISDDGETVFFVAGGQIVAGGSTAPGVKLYRWHWNGGSPTVDFLTGLSSSDGMNWNAFNQKNSNLAVTPDGEHLLIETSISIDQVADGNSSQDIYRWSEDDGWACVSCVNGLSGGASILQLEQAPVNDDLRHPMSDDGSRVTFMTTSGLVPEDTNGRKDVYQWHDGAINLISTGVGPDPVDWIGSSTDGEDVFFITRERLVGWDGDFNSDIYVSRVGGGFPEPPAVGVPCDTADACHGAASSPGNVPGAGTRPFVASVPRPTPNTCGSISKKAQRKRGAARKAARNGQVKRARALRKQANNLNRRAKRCNRRQAR